MQKEFFEMAYSNTALLKSLLENAIGYVEDETHKLADFVQANLRKTVFTVPERETETKTASRRCLWDEAWRKAQITTEKPGA